jgi:MscS family membrane protein
VSSRRIAVAICTLFFASASATAQEAAAPGAAPAEAPAAAAQTPAPASAEPEQETDYSLPMGPEDSYNRGTPRGSVYGFAKAAAAGDWERASEYLDLRRVGDPEQRGRELARQLKTVLDQTVIIDYENLAPDDAGSSDDGLPAWQDRLAAIESQSGSLDVLLQRIPREGDGVRIWKFSAQTLDRVPELYDEFGFGLLEAYLPAIFFEKRFLDVELWQWAGVSCVLFAAWLLSWVFASIVVKVLATLTTRTRSSLDDRVIHLVRNPARLLLGVLIFHAGTVVLGLSPDARATLVALERTLVVIAVAWLFLQLVDLTALAMQERMALRDPGGAALVSPGRRSARALIIVLTGLFLLDNLGFNVAALVAGLGVGGIAVALAGQKTVENLFGGVTVMLDQPVRVGDFCRYGDKIGTVEEIGLRSTRVRTLERTVVTVPNAEFSSLQIENFAKRERIRLHTVLGLRYETTNEQLRFVLTRLRELLLAHPKIDPDSARVRFEGFGAYSLDIEINSYALTSDWNEFLGIREDVYLRIMDVVEEAGSGFAFPSSTTYVGRDDGLDEKSAREAQERVAAWRDGDELPFPDLSPERRAELLDTLDWPPEGSHGKPRHRPPSQGADE